MTKRVLVTGISGFIGSHLAKKLVERGYEVYGVVKYVVGRDMKILENISKDIIVVTCDIADYNSVESTLQNVMPDYVIHLAALSPVRLSFEKPFEFQMNNYIGTLNIAHSMLKLPDYENRRLVVASTAEVYGIQPKNEPYKEGTELRPSSPYAVSKAAKDMYIRMMMEVYGLNATVMRCINTYGRKHGKGFLVEYLINQMLEGNKIYIGAPDSVREYMYVDDHVDAYIRAMEDEKARGEVFNVSPGRPMTNAELAIMLADMIGYDKNNLVLGSYPPNYPRRPLSSDQPYLALDATKIKEVLGWKTSVTLEEGLKKTIEYWKANKN